MKVNTTTASILALADGLDAGRGVMGPSPLAAVLRALVGERDAMRDAIGIHLKAWEDRDGDMTIPQLRTALSAGANP